MRNVIYKDHLIKYHFKNQWLASVYPLESKLTLSGGATTATKEEGETISDLLTFTLALMRGK
jgi:hypothetical protein